MLFKLNKRSLLSTQFNSVTLTVMHIICSGTLRNLNIQPSMQVDLIRYLNNLESVYTYSYTLYSLRVN